MKRWARVEFYDWCDRGFFEESPIFLYTRGPDRGAADGAETCAGGGANLSVALPHVRPGVGDPNPLPFETPAEAMRSRHPNRAVPLIEVADSSVELDREKAFDPAAALVPDYWLIDLRDEEVEVYRDPVEDPASATGFRYASHRVHRDVESIAPLAKPEAVVEVATLVRKTDRAGST